MGERLLWVGTYTRDSEPAGCGVGVYLAWMDTESGRLGGGGAAVEAVGPSFLAMHPDGGKVYAVSERMEGALSWFAAGEGWASVTLGEAPTRGAAPCHVLVHPAGKHVIAANYFSGSVSVHSIEGDAAPGAAVALLEGEGSGPVPGRQEGPRAHSTAIAPGGRHLLIADLGADVLRVHPFDADDPEPVGEALEPVRLDPGTGPRHMAVHPAGFLYVSGELDARVHVLQWDQDKASAWSLGAYEASQYDGEVEAVYPSEIALSATGERLYVANRGADTVTTFAVEEGGASLRFMAEYPTGGKWPRHFAVTSGHVVVANQLSGTVTSMPIDEEGVAGEAVDRLSIPDPACVLPVGE